MPPLRIGSCVLAMVMAVAACDARTEVPQPPPADTVTNSEVSGVAARHAIVTLLPAGGSIAIPAEPAVMDQRAKQFLPSVLLARVGQPIEFRNSEDMPHNVAVSRRESGTEIFNVGTDPHQKYVHTFDRIGQFDVKCDIHEGMEATLIVSNGPLTTIADDTGGFTFSNVTPGAYTVSMTFAGQTVEQALDVRGPRTTVKLTR